MNFQFSRFVLCGCLAAALGCQNPVKHAARLGDRDSLETQFAFASDDPSGLESGRGHLPSLASEMADHRHQAEEQDPSGLPGVPSLTVQRLLEHGNDADAHGRAQEAKTYYEQAIAEQPNNPEAHHRLAILADRDGDFALAERHYQKALRVKPHNADVLNDFGYSCFLQGRAADSERYLKQARQINPRHPHAQENLSLLSDPAKAEKVLMAVLGPRQTQQAMAQLFQGPLRGMPQQPMAQMPGGEINSPDRAPNHDIGETPSNLESLQRKMEEARLRSLAERQQRESFEQHAATPNQMAGLPQPPPNNSLPQVPPQRGFGASAALPDGRINGGFRSFDDSGYPAISPEQNAGLRANQSSQVPVFQESGRIPNTPAPPISGQMTPPDQRAAAPRWNTPPQAWPRFSSESATAQTIEQTHFTQPHSAYPSSGSPRQSWPSAAQRAAEIGMAAGPGAMFPNLDDSMDSSTPRQGPVPGTNTQGAPSNSNWDTPSSPQANPAGWGQPAAAWDGQVHQPEVYTAGFGSQPQAQTGLMTSGPPGQQALPGTFDPSQQSWPTYTREQYDTRQMDQPPANTQPPMLGQGNFGGQSSPQYNPALQQAPQNHGRSW